MHRVHLDEDRIEVGLDSLGLLKVLGIDGPQSDDFDVPVITFDAVRVRRGHQLRLVIPGPTSTSATAARRNDKLIALVAEAHQARELVLANPQLSIASIAHRHSRCRTRLRKLVALSCLAPDIAKAIVEGRQPEHITARRLANCEIPLAWPKQREELGFS